MVSSASSEGSQRSQGRAGERALRETRPRHGPYGNRGPKRRLPHARLTNAVAEAVVEEREGVVAAIPHGAEGLEMGPRDADRSVVAHVGAAEDDDDDGDQVCQVQGVTPSRTMVRSGKDSLPVTASEGVAKDDDANVTQQEVCGKNKDGADELCVDATPAQGLICPEVQATEEEEEEEEEEEVEPVRGKSPRELKLESIAAQIGYLRRQVRMHKARTNSLMLASDARLARTAWVAYPRGCDRETRDRLIDDQMKTLLHFKSLLNAKKAQQRHILHGIHPSPAQRAVLASPASEKAELVVKLVKMILA